MHELCRDLCTTFLCKLMLELCRDARKNECCGAHKKLCHDAKNILLTHLPVSDAGWSCDGRSVVNGLSDDHKRVVLATALLSQLNIVSYRAALER